MKTTQLKVEDRSHTDPAKAVSVRLDDLLSVLDRAADYLVIPCHTITLPDGMCPNCRDTLELKADLLKMASILRAEAQEKMNPRMKHRHHPAFDEYGEHR